MAVFVLVKGARRALRGVERVRGVRDTDRKRERSGVPASAHSRATELEATVAARKRVNRNRLGTRFFSSGPSVCAAARRPRGGSAEHSRPRPRRRPVSTQTTQSPARASYERDSLRTTEASRFRAAPPRLVLPAPGPGPTWTAMLIRTQARSSTEGGNSEGSHRDTPRWSGQTAACRPACGSPANTHHRGRGRGLHGRSSEPLSRWPAPPVCV